MPVNTVTARFAFVVVVDTVATVGTIDCPAASPAVLLKLTKLLLGVVAVNVGVSFPAVAKNVP